jgi:predicted nucleotidyltransferase component of viral defense system
MINKGKSVIDRLKEKSKSTGKPLQLYLQLFCQEEFLRKVSLSDYIDNLILKGGLFIYALSNFESRTTTDVDFLLTRLPNSIEKIKVIIENILAVDTGNEFITFTVGNFKKISVHRKYSGISFQLVGSINNTHTPFSVDIGFDDIIIPNSEKRILPVQLTDFSSPTVNTYSLESTIAEKLDAILQRLSLTSRMKDFYDIYYLAHAFDFDGQVLREAIVSTFQNRSTSFLSESRELIFDLGNNIDMQNKWIQFQKRLKLPTLIFEDVINAIDIFLSPIWKDIASDTKLSIKWSASRFIWD